MYPGAGVSYCDFDPLRKDKIASDEQHQDALKQATLAKTFLYAQFPNQEIGLASSGNGVHLLVPVDTPNDEPSKEIIRRVQRSIAERFSTPQVEVECFPDAARLVRAYGTLNKKGKETDGLKWRRSCIL